ncbi:hypothetical protein Tco_0798814 [Tanacetum coccineum]
MPNVEQVFRLNSASFGGGEKKQDDTPDYTVFVGDLAADVTDYTLQKTFSAQIGNYQIGKETYKEMPSKHMDLDLFPPEIRGTSHFTREGGGPEGQDDWEATPHPLTKEQIGGTYPPLGLKTPLTRRIIEFAGTEYKMPTNIKLYDGTIDPEDHLGRFASAANSGEWPMLVWCRMFQQTLDEPARGWFECLPANIIDEWADLREEFTTRYSVRKTCFKEPHKVTKIIRRANESLTAFKERWIVETGFIMGVPKIMKISSFMDLLKCLELAKRF